MTSRGWRLGVAAVLTAAVVSAQAPRVLQPVFELRLQNGHVFDDSVYAPLIADVCSIVADSFGVQGEQRQTLAGAWRSLYWPIVLQVAYDPDEDAGFGGIWTPLPSSPLLGTLVSLMPGARELDPVKLDDDSWRRASCTVQGFDLTVAEGVAGSRRLLLTGTKEDMADLAGVVAGMARLSDRDTPAHRALAAHADAGDVGWILDVRAVISGSQRESLIGIVAALELIFGPRFAGVAGNVSTTEKGLALELYADIRPARGIVGSLALDEPRKQTILGWLPADAAEHVAIDVSVDGVVRFLNGWASSIAGAADGIASELGLGDAHHLERLIDSHFDGQVLVVTGARRQDGTDPVVVGIGVYDGTEIVPALKQTFADSKEIAANRANNQPFLFPMPPPPPFEVVPATDVAPDAVTVQRPGDAVLLAPTKNVVFLTDPDTGKELLQKVLATQGASPVPEPATITGRGHVLTRLLELTDWLSHEQSLGSQLREAVEHFVAGHDPDVRWQLTIDRAGAVLHADL